MNRIVEIEPLENRRGSFGRVATGIGTALLFPLFFSDLFAGEASEATNALRVEKVRKPVVNVVESHFTATRCGRGVLSITIRIDPGWRINSITQKKTKAGAGPFITRIEPASANSYRLCGPFSTNAKLLISRSEEFWPGLRVEEHEGTVTWMAPIQLSAGIDRAKITIKGKLFAPAWTLGNGRVITPKFVARHKKR